MCRQYAYFAVNVEHAMPMARIKKQSVKNHLIITFSSIFTDIQNITHCQESTQESIPGIAENRHKN